jgi:hypothetical protein
VTGPPQQRTHPGDLAAGRQVRPEHEPAFPNLLVNAASIGLDAESTGLREAFCASTACD